MQQTRQGRPWQSVRLSLIHIFNELDLFAGGHAGGGEVALFVQRVVGLGDEVAFLLGGGDVFDGVGDPAVFQDVYKRQVRYVPCRRSGSSAR